MKKIIQVIVLFAALAAFAGQAVANEFTEVIDAFDTDINDPFDLNLSVGYRYVHKSGVLRREAFDKPSHPWDYFPYHNYFNFDHKQHILDLNLEIGIFKDMSLRFGLPLILKDMRELTAHKDFSDWPAGQIADVAGDGAPGGLFNLPFKSPDRSGVDYFSVGLWWSPLEQSRDDTKPTWTIFAEGRFSVGESLVASCHDATQEIPGADGGSPTCEQQGMPVNKGGVSRGVNEIRFGTRLSRRYGRLDPYFGIDAMIGWAKDGTSYFVAENKSGMLNDMPPIVGTLDFGMEIVAWEVVEEHRKLSIGLGAGATYHSEGREYSPLFDALGVSPYLNSSESTDFNQDGSIDVPEGELDDQEAQVSWSGMTDVENYATLFGKAFLMIQPAKYIKFRIGGFLSHETEHFITKTDLCTADNMTTDSSERLICETYNWGHRPELDAPGKRFRAEETIIGTFFVDATAMF
jgi:hypothetical protein